MKTLRIIRPTLITLIIRKEAGNNPLFLEYIEFIKKVIINYKPNEETSRQNLDNYWTLCRIYTFWNKYWIRNPEDFDKKCMRNITDSYLLHCN